LKDIKSKRANSKYYNPEMAFTWQTFDFSEYPPVRVENFVPGNSYIVLSTSDAIYPNRRWVVTFDSFATIDPNKPLGYINATIVNSTDTDFITILNSNNPNMVFTTDNRAFYNESVLHVENYLKLRNRIFPVDIVQTIAEY
jgi:hypothetical protein